MTLQDKLHKINKIFTNFKKKLKNFIQAKKAKKINNLNYCI
jgi:hypothetical protein